MGVARCAAFTDPEAAHMARNELLPAYAHRHAPAFLSFAAEDGVEAQAFRRMFLKEHPNVDLLDHAATGDYEPNWKANCERKIRESALLICLLGPSTHRSEAVTWEIECGLAVGLPVLAVNPTGRTLQLPRVLERNRIEPQSAESTLAAARLGRIE